LNEDYISQIELFVGNLLHYLQVKLDIENYVLNMNIQMIRYKYQAHYKKIITYMFDGFSLREYYFTESLF